MDRRVITKENKKRNQYLDFTREFKMQWNIRMTVIPIVIGVLGAIPLVKRLEELKIRGRNYKLQHC